MIMAGACGNFQKIKRLDVFLLFSFLFSVILFLQRILSVANIFLSEGAIG